MASPDPNRWTFKTQEAFNAAVELARDNANPEVTSDHLLATLLRQTDGLVFPLLKKLDRDPIAIRSQTEMAIGDLPRSIGGETRVGRPLQRVLKDADSVRLAFRDEYVSTEHLLFALANRDPSGHTAARIDLERSDMSEALTELRAGRRITSQSPEDGFQALDRYGRDLTAAARLGELDPVIGRNDEIRRLMEVLSRRTKNNPILIGEPGVGKTAIVEGLARRIAEGDVSEGLRSKRVVSLDLASLLAGTKHRGDFEERLTAVLEEIAASDGEVITFIDELHNVVGAGSSDGPMNAANMLKPMLARGQLRMVGATTLDEYRVHIETDAALERRFQPLHVGEPSVEDAIAILRGLKERYEIHHGIRIQDAALVAAVELSERYISDRFLPDKAIDLVDEASARLRIDIDSMPAEIDDVERRVRRLEIERVALEKERDLASPGADESQTKKRLQAIDEEIDHLSGDLAARKERWENERDGIARLGELRSELEQRRTEADRETDLERAAELRYGTIPDLERDVTEATEHLVGLQADRRMLKEDVDSDDIAAVVHRWTGVPVHRLIRGEADRLLQLEDQLRERVIEQDVAVVAVADSIRRGRTGLSDPNRPVGSFLFLGPTGVGKTELAHALAEAMFDDDRAIIRIDMTEYAEKHTISRLVGAPPGYVGHDEGGQLTEAVRRRPYAVVLLDEVEKAHPEVIGLLLQVLDEGRLTDGRGRVADFTNAVLIMTSNLEGEPVTHFRPEFINRIDDIIRFASLELDAIRRIVELQIWLLADRLAGRRIDLEVTADALDALADQAYDPAFGARPVRRLVEAKVGAMIAKRLLDGEVVPDSRLVVDVLPDSTFRIC